MTRILIIAGHLNIENLRADGLCDGPDPDTLPDRLPDSLRRGTGTGGERALMAAIAPKVVELLKARGYEAAWTDASGDDLTRQRWDLLLALHAQRDRATSRAFAGIPAEVGVCDKPYVTQTARDRGAQFAARFHHEWPILTGIPTTGDDGAGANLVHYYLWDFVDENTAVALLELGHMDIDGERLQDLTNMSKGLDFLVDEWAHDFGLAPVAAPLPPSPIATFPVAGVWEGDVAALDAAVMKMSEGRAPIGLAELYVEVGQQAKIRADVAIAQAMHETGLFKYEGTVRPDWNNFAGIGITSSEAVQRFPGVLAGAKAHLYHLAWYAYPDHVGPDCNLSVDPRHFNGHQGNVKTVADLGGKWAPSASYGERVAKHLVALRALVAAYVPPAQPAPPAPAFRELVGDLERGLTALDGIARDMRALVG